jgi:hypothetical protein
MGLTFSTTQGWQTEMNLLAGNCKKLEWIEQLLIVLLCAWKKWQALHLNYL